MNPFSKRVAARWVLRRELENISKTPFQGRTASTRRAHSELTPEVLGAFVTASQVRVSSVRQALNIASKIKDLWGAFTSNEGAWEKFKRLIGVKADSMLEAIRELPRKILELGNKGKELLGRLGDWLVEKVPLFKIYSEAYGKVPSLNNYLIKLVDYLPPKIAGAIKGAAKGVVNLAKMVDEFLNKHPYAAIAGTFASAALFTVIWLNVTEISWDVGDIVKGFLGLYSFSEIVHSIPEAGVGLILTLIFPGLPSAYLLNALLPLTVAARITWMIAQNYASWDRGELTIHWEKLGVSPPSFSF